MMKNCIISKKTKMLFLVFNLLLISTLKSQTLAETVVFAGLQYENKDFVGAAESYERILFFDSTQQFSTQIYFNLAECLYHQKRFEEAARQYEKAYFSVENDSLKTHILFQKASCFLLEKNYTSAQVELFNLPDSLDKKSMLRRELFLGMTTFAINDFETSEAHFEQYIEGDSVKKAEIQRLFKKNQKISKLSPQKAKVMSMILPGLGQFYAGDIKNGLNSMLLTGGLLTWAIRIATKTTFIDAFLTVVPWFQRYYNGGYNRAEVIAQNAIKRRRNEVYNQLLNVVE
jgi:tetratricopeptide (TPR) repeat protein